MEKFNPQDYRDDLAKTLVNEREKGTVGKEAAREILSGEKGKKEYQKAQKWHRRYPDEGIVSLRTHQIEKTQKSIEETREALSIRDDIQKMVGEARWDNLRNINYHIIEEIPEAPEINLLKEYPSKKVTVKVHSMVLAMPQTLADESKEDSYDLPDIDLLTEVFISGPDLKFLLNIKKQFDSLSGLSGAHLNIEHPDYDPAK